MSFGWSAGDIATAIGLILKIVQALGDADGATSDYREAVAFLANLKRTLEPLKTFSALDVFPAYGDEIKQYVDRIKKPIEECLEVAKDFEPGLGAHSKSGRHLNMGAKLLWRFKASKKVTKLRLTIEGHMLGLDSLLNRLTL